MQTNRSFDARLPASLTVPTPGNGVEEIGLTLHTLGLSWERSRVAANFRSGRPFGRSAIAASGSVAAIFKEASKRSPQAPGNPNINHD
jgi:hypothetical protein